MHFDIRGSFNFSFLFFSSSSQYIAIHLILINSFLLLLQVDVDPKIFLRADPQVMKNTMSYLRTKFGSINSFLDFYGFDDAWRAKLR